MHWPNVHVCACSMNGDEGDWDFATMKKAPAAMAKQPAPAAVTKQQPAPVAARAVPAPAPTPVAAPPKLDDSKRTAAPAAAPAPVPASKDSHRDHEHKKDKKEKKEKEEKKSSSKHATPTVAPTAAAAPAPVTTVAQPAAAAAANGVRPSALTSVIYPVLSKLLKTHQDEATVTALAQLKVAFDNAERAQPGITHTMIAQIIETLKR